MLNWLRRKVGKPTFQVNHTTVENEAIRVTFEEFEGTARVQLDAQFWDGKYSYRSHVTLRENDLWNLMAILYQKTSLLNPSTIGDYKEIREQIPHYDDIKKWDFI